MIDITSKCGEVFHADEKFVGQKIKCPKCGEILTIQFPEIQKQKKSETFKAPTFTYTTKTQKPNYKSPRKFKIDLRRVMPFLILLLPVSVIVIGFLLLRDNSSNKGNHENRPESGNVYNEKLNPSQSDNSAYQSAQNSVNNKENISQRSNINSDNSNNQPVVLKKISRPVDPYVNWDKVDMPTGTSPDCYNFTPAYDFTIDNKLQVNVSSNTDVVIKLCSYTTGKCIRYVYIRNGTTYNITNIPQDRYYTKIAYGKDWRQKIENGQCIGKFVKNALYKKGEKVLNFHKEYSGMTREGDYEYTNYNIPSYSLSLDVIETDFNENIYHTNSISEDEFNK